MRSWIETLWTTHFIDLAFAAWAAVAGVAAFFEPGLIVPAASWEEALGDGDPGGAGDADMV